MTIPAITLDFCSEPVDVLCPVCGEQIFSSGVQKDICPHVLFTADSAAGQWAWHQDHHQPLFVTVVEKEYAAACKNGFYADLETYTTSLRPDTAANLASGAISGKSIFMLSISPSDIGCGGMHNGTIHVIFDYLPTTPKLIQPCAIKY